MEVSSRDIGRQVRISRKIELKSEKWLVVCEGIKTEVNYFNSLFEYINSKYDRKIKYEVKGAGRNTESLVRYVGNYFASVSYSSRKSDIPYAKVFVAFDKDSFGREQFDNAINMAQRKKYIALWSNECFELWYILHFEMLEEDIGRKEYFRKLDKLFGCKYDKSAKDHFWLLNSERNLGTAIARAKELYNRTADFESYSDRVPCTTVFRLTDEIERHLNVGRIEL